MITNINYNQVNNVIDNELKFYSGNILANNPVKVPLTIVTISLIGGKKSIHTLKSYIICLWFIGATNRMIKCKHINRYKSKLIFNKVEYIIADGPCKTTHDVKVSFILPGFYSSRIITHCFHMDNVRYD